MPSGVQLVPDTTLWLPAVTVQRTVCPGLIVIAAGENLLLGVVTVTSGVTPESAVPVTGVAVLLAQLSVSAPRTVTPRKRKRDDSSLMRAR